jgi:hypothetical protein
MEKSLFKNKKAFSLSSWSEVALMTVLFMLLFIGLVAEFNVKFSENYDGSFGLSNAISTTQQSFEDYQATLEKSVKEGQSSSTGLGISLSTTWSIISSGATIMWSFLTGGFIEQIGGMLMLPTAVSQILRVLFVLSIGFIILKLVLRIKP